MNLYLKRFIEDNINLIENQMYDELYYQAQVHGSPIEYSGCGGLTQCLHQIDIYPEYYFKELPEDFLSQAEGVLAEYTIPDNIKKINKNFGWRSHLENFYIGENVIELASDSLAEIEGLIYFEIPASVQIIG